MPREKFEALVRETEVAKLLNVSVRTVQGWRLDGRGPPFVRIGRSVRYRRADLRRFIGR